MLTKLIDQAKYTLCQRYSFPDRRVVIANLDRRKVDDFAVKLIGYVLMERKGPIVIHDLGVFSADFLAALIQRGDFTVTVQFLRQLTPALRETVLGIPDKVAWRTSKADAEELQVYFGLGNPNVLVDLQPGEALSTTDGLIKPIMPKSLKRLRAVRKLSRTASRPRRTVQAWIDTFLGD
jgi:hypothetical protein